ncbi:hypothetical protein [uncultured Algoriphagus sp.]|uniref:hypothetical protein n=1 Tax=uncultured Algoriphagus sp. TaxID=417365 RepID=UPI0030EE2BE6|tara:strand:+ start:54072 stop:54269 length:198 start_codon:yes stop_codon:yes gene_type:complete
MPTIAYYTIGSGKGSAAKIALIQEENYHLKVEISRDKKRILVSVHPSADRSESACCCCNSEDLVN